MFVYRFLSHVHAFLVLGVILFRPRISHHGAASVGINICMEKVRRRSRAADYYLNSTAEKPRFTFTRRRYL